MITSNPQFSRATVNLIWSKLMTVGFVEPWDGFDLARIDPKNPPPKPWTVQPNNPELMEALAETGATCLITTELRRPGFERSIDYEEYLAHGVILLQQLQVGKSLLRVIQIEKMRKTPVDNQPRPYRITDTGIEVFPRESVL
jgi:hypothetical protein